MKTSTTFKSLNSARNHQLVEKDHDSWWVYRYRTSADHKVMLCRRVVYYARNKRDALDWIKRQQMDDLGFCDTAVHDWRRFAD